MLTNKIWIYGWHLCDRWRYLPVQLAEVWRAGLPVYRVHDLAVQVPGQSCLECTCATAEGLPGCSDPDVCEIDYPRFGYDANGREMEYTYQLDDGQVGARLFGYAYVFDLSEVEAFEQARGLTIWTQACQDQVEQPKRSKKQIAQDNIKAERQKIFDRLLEIALAYSEEFISQNRRMRKNEDLYPYLCANSNGEEVSHDTNKAIWEKLPAAAKKGPGRPRSAE